MNVTLSRAPYCALAIWVWSAKAVVVAGPEPGPGILANSTRQPSYVHLYPLSTLDHFDMSSFTGRDFLLRGQHVAQLFLSLYGGALSYVAITNLRKYEAASKKLAEWSSTAEHELWKTRTTQATGALAVRSRLLPTLAVGQL